MNNQTHEKPDRTVARDYLGKVLSAHPFFPISLPSLDYLGQLLGHTVKMNPFEHSNM